MSHYKDPYAPPLAPQVPVDRPPWVPCWKEYNGRPEWYAALGYKHPDIRRGVTNGISPNFEEGDVRWMDPKVPDGTSLAGPQGNDSQYHTPNNNKFFTIGNFYEHQKMLRNNSLQYKQILEKWDLSDEHPDIAVSPTLFSIFRDDSRTLGQNTSAFPFTHNFINWRAGPRFWDRPMNEGCLEKGLALAKYTVPITLVGYLTYLRGRGIPGMNQNDIHLLHFIQAWYRKALVLPVFYAFTFGLTSCAAATFRDKDDSRNWIIASAVCGLANYAITNNLPRSAIMTLVGTFFGIYFQIIRISPYGFELPFNRMTQGHFHFTGPLHWKRWPLESMETSNIAHVQEWTPI